MVMGGPLQSRIAAPTSTIWVLEPSSVTTRCFSLGDSESVGTLLAGIGLHPLMTLQGRPAAWYDRPRCRWMLQNVSGRASRVILATTAGFSPESGPPVSIVDRSAPFAPQGRLTFSFFRPPRLLKWGDFGRVCGAVPRPRHFPVPGSEAGQRSSAQYGLSSRMARSTRRERRSRHLPSGSA